MWNVQHHERNVRLRDLEHRLERALVQVVGMLQCCGSGQDPEVISMFGQQPIEQHIIDAAGVLDRFLDPLRGAHVEAQACASERQVHVRKNDV